ncbi:MAG: L-2-hydroxyglutarate oxidase [Planctomycetes bacterium]|nr:L-2-hydroxyglutarate oxidase [Planctomycetota bacterium]
MPDFVIIGGGIIGLTVAIELKRRRPSASVELLEKEPEVGLHASGRNSGVIHAGFYYSADSMKARFCREGNRRLRAYCSERKLPLNTCGKLVVAKDGSELAGLDELLRRGRANGVELEMLSVADAQRIEPRVITCERALWSPTTASADPARVIASFAQDARDIGVVVRRGVAYRHGAAGRVETSAGTIEAGFVVNAGGLHADRIARDFGFSQHHTILPFKGLYLYSREPAGALRTHIYPVPDLKYPFLGVHYTVTVDGHIKIGPTAIPAFWRENYSGMANFDLGECAEVLIREAGLMLHAGFDFRGLAVQELKKFSRSYLVAQAAKLITGVDRADYREWGRPGIRAQLLDLRTRTLVMDFLIEGDARSLHVLIAVSPAWTCSLPFADHVVYGIEARMEGENIRSPSSVLRSPSTEM